MSPRGQKNIRLLFPERRYYISTRVSHAYAVTTSPQRYNGDRLRNSGGRIPILSEIRRDGRYTVNIICIIFANKWKRFFISVKIYIIRADSTIETRGGVDSHVRT